jgi:hypothetical protein
MDVIDPSKLGTDVATQVTKDVSFFEKNPKATAIGSAIAGALLVIGLQFAVHYFF